MGARSHCGSNSVSFFTHQPALKRRLSRHKVKITRRLPVSFGAQGWCDSIYFEDPNGVTVEVRYYGKDARNPLSAAQQRAQAQQTAKMLDTARGKSGNTGRGKAKAGRAAKGGREKAKAAGGRRGA